MATWDAIRALVDALGPLAGSRRPLLPTELPRVVVSASEVTEELAGIGGLVGARAVAADRWATTGGSRAAGVIEIELWGATEDDVLASAAAVFGLIDDPATLGAAGFIALSPRSIGPIRQSFLGVGDDTALSMAVACAFVFEAVAVEEEGPGGIIRRVHADVHDDSFDEALDVT